MHSCVTFLLRYNDYIITLVNAELCLLYYFSKPLAEVEWRSD